MMTQSLLVTKTREEVLAYLEGALDAISIRRDALVFEYDGLYAAALNLHDFAWQFTHHLHDRHALCQNKIEHADTDDLRRYYLDMGIAVHRVAKYCGLVDDLGNWMPRPSATEEEDGQ